MSGWLKLNRTGDYIGENCGSEKDITETVENQRYTFHFLGNKAFKYTVLIYQQYCDYGLIKGMTMQPNRLHTKFEKFVC